MSGRSDDLPRDDRDLLAGEHALGVLEGADLAEAERLMAADPAFARAVEAWRNRLHPLADLAPPAEPPADLWQRIEAAIREGASRETGNATSGDDRPPDAAVPARDNVLPARDNILPARGNVVPLRRVRMWQGATGVSLALAASIAAFALLRPPPPSPELPRVAVLAPMTGAAPGMLAALRPNGAVTIQPNGPIIVPAGRDLELWLLAAGDTQPRSLGVLPAGGTHLTANLATGSRLLVSLEPRGGSPTGQPTGPVLYGGTVTTLE